MISFTIDGTTLSLSKRDNALACNGSERRFPYLSSYRRVNDALVLLLKDRPVETAPDVSLPSKARNVEDREGNVLLYAEIAMGVRPSLVVDPRTGEPVDE